MKRHYGTFKLLNGLRVEFYGSLMTVHLYSRLFWIYSIVAAQFRFTGTCVVRI